jgi:hypothetical protein
MQSMAAGITVGLASLFTTMAAATPTTTYWTPAAMDIQAPGVWHVTYDSYFTVGRKGPGNGGESFPTDMGLTYGLRISDKVLAEAGFDVLEPTDHPLYFNAKVGYPEGALGARAPAIQIAIFNVGTRRGVTNQNVVHVILGKTLPRGMGRVHVSFYRGNGDCLRSSTGEVENTGFMVAYDRWLVPGKFMLAADYASGDNAIGGGGVGLYTFFNKDIDLLVGPVWFNDRGINGKMKWTAQLDINF